MNKSNNFIKSLSFSKIIIIVAPLAVVVISQLVFNRDSKYFLPDLSLASGIISYFISIYLIDSTDQIKEKIQTHNLSALQLQTNIKKLKENGESLSISLNNFKEIILKIEIEYNKSEVISTELLEEYDMNRLKLATILEDYRVAIIQYGSKDFNFDNYILLINRTRVNQVKRSLSEILREMKSQTQRLIMVVELIPQLDELNKGI